MMDFAAIDAPSRCGRIQAIALRQEMRQRAALWLKGFPGTAVSRLKSSTGRPWMSTLALILNPTINVPAGHACLEIGQVKGQSSRGHSHRICGIQTEEPNAGLALRRHIGPNVQLEKCGEPRQRGRPTQSHARHAERHNTEPRLPLECIDLQFRW